MITARSPSEIARAAHQSGRSIPEQLEAERRNRQRAVDAAARKVQSTTPDNSRQFRVVNSRGKTLVADETRRAEITSAFEHFKCKFRAGVHALDLVEANDWHPIDTRITLREIADQICEKHDVTLAELRCPRRVACLVLARHEFWWRAKHETVQSLPAIGRFLNKDHTSALHGIRRYQALLDKSAIPVLLLRIGKRKRVRGV